MAQPCAATLSPWGKKFPRIRPLAIAISVLLFGEGFSDTANATDFPPMFDLGSLNGSNGFRLDGVNVFDTAGIAVSRAGDINGDGIEDLIVAADGFSPFANIEHHPGAAYVVFGKNTPFDAVATLSNLDGSNGFRIDGAGSQDLLGYSVSAAGDVNGDGFDDLVVGSPGSQSIPTLPATFKSGSVYVVFGKSTPFAATLSGYSGLNGSNGFRIDGLPSQASSMSRAGHSVGAGDVNGDGFSDLIIGAPGDYQGGSIYVVFGKSTPFAGVQALSSLNGSDGFRLTGASIGSLLGTSVSNAGDINGDGTDDVIAGDISAASSYVLFGKTTAFAAVASVNNLNGNNGFRIDSFGLAVSGAGDINGDGKGDVVVGNMLAQPNGIASGSAAVIFGKSAPFSSLVSISGLNGSNGFRIDGDETEGRLGSAVSRAGDINGDGLDDLIVGAMRANDGYGGSFVVFGRPTSFPANLPLSSLDGTTGFRLNSPTGMGWTGFTPAIGASVGGAGDVNGDGVDDLIIGAPLSQPNGDTSGAALVVFGRKRDPIFNSGFE